MYRPDLSRSAQSRSHTMAYTYRTRAQIPQLRARESTNSVLKQESNHCVLKWASCKLVSCMICKFSCMCLGWYLKTREGVTHWSNNPDSRRNGTVSISCKGNTNRLCVSSKWSRIEVIMTAGTQTKARTTYICKNDFLTTCTPSPPPPAYPSPLPNANPPSKSVIQSQILTSASKRLTRVERVPSVTTQTEDFSASAPTTMYQRTGNAWTLVSQFRQVESVLHKDDSERKLVLNRKGYASTQHIKWYQMITQHRGVELSLIFVCVKSSVTKQKKRLQQNHLKSIMDAVEMCHARIRSGRNVFFSFFFFAAGQSGQSSDDSMSTTTIALIAVAAVLGVALVGVGAAYLIKTRAAMPSGHSRFGDEDRLFNEPPKGSLGSRPMASVNPVYGLEDGAAAAEGGPRGFKNPGFKMSELTEGQSADIYETMQ